MKNKWYLKNEKRSPLKEKPLRYAGQSLNERIDDIVGENVIAYVLAISFTLFIAFEEWWRFFYKSAPHPVFATIIALTTMIFVLWKFQNLKKDISSLKLGRDGERIVAQELDVLKRQNYHVFHDIQAEKFNLDHIVLSPQGIFVIETKTFSKPQRGNPKVRFDGSKISVDGVRVDRDPINQAQALRRWMQEILKKSTGRDYPVKAVVVFPGWFVEVTNKTTNSAVWVMNPKQFTKYVVNMRQILSTEELQLAVFHLSLFIQSKERSG